MPVSEKNLTRTEMLDGIIGSKINTKQNSCDTKDLGKQTQINHYDAKETPEEVEAIRLAIKEGEESIKREGYSKRSVDEIFDSALGKYILKYG